MWGENTLQGTENFERGFRIGRGRGFSSHINLNDINPKERNSTFASTFSNAKSENLWDESNDVNEKPKYNNWKSSDDDWEPAKNDTKSQSLWNSDDSNWNPAQKFKNNDESEEFEQSYGFSYNNKGRFKCGEEGYVNREYPKNSSQSGNRKAQSKKRKPTKGCFKCGEEGHMSRDCPNSDNRKGSGCFKCGENGHISRDCTNSDNKKGSGCFKCGENGHISRDCTNSDNKKGSACYKCGESGHISRDCTNSNSKNGSGCFKCGESGHISRDCTKSDSKKGSGCFKCGQDGHFAKDCTESKQTTVGPPKENYIPPEPIEDETKLFESVPTGINFSKYDSIPVEVSGQNIPLPLNTFEEANFLPTLYQNIQKLKYTKPTPVQKYSIPIILAKRDLMACAQTGSGKTAAFLLPIIQYMLQAPDLPNPSSCEVQEPWAIIISPTRELAIQIYNEARKFSFGSILKVELVYGGTSVGYQINRLKRGCHVLVATPGRLLDFIDKDKVSFGQLRYLILDEADRMLDMGFAPEIRKMIQNSSMPPKGKKQMLMFSATFPAEIQRLAADFLDNYLFLTVGVVGSANKDVEQSFHQVPQSEKRPKLQEILRDTGISRTLVFVEQKRTADFIASFMSQCGFPTTSIHGDRLQREREEALMDFRTGRMPILVATAVAARGLDIKDVCHVINYDLPQTIQEYVHRIGRTGRVGNLGKATSFYDPAVDQPLATELLKILHDSNQIVPEWLESEANQIGTFQSSYTKGNRYGAKDVRSLKKNSWGSDNSSEKQEAFSNNAPEDLDDCWE